MSTQPRDSPALQDRRRAHALEVRRRELSPRRRVANLIGAAIWLATAATLAAQAPPPDTVRTSARVQPRLRCYRGRPAPACRTFIITELGYSRALATISEALSGPPGPLQPSANELKDFSDRAALEVGLMRNHGSASAIGATLLLGGSSAGVRYGSMARYRRWLNADGTSLDVAAGAIFGRLPRSRLTATLATDVALNFSDYGAIVAGVEMARPDGRTRRAMFGGARLGSKPGLIATGVSMLVGLVGLIALASWTNE